MITYKKTHRYYKNGALVRTWVETVQANIVLVGFSSVILDNGDELPKSSLGMV